MANYFTDNRDLQFILNNLDLEKAVALKENDYKYAEQYDTAPTDLSDALDNYKRVLENIGEICGENIEERSRTVDREGPHFEDGVVTYHPLTVKNLEDLRKADVMGIMLPHKYGGINFPVTVYAMITEMVSRADASLQNLIGLQDIADTICEFGNEEQKDKYLPLFAAGIVDGSMDLTEPDSGSDLQSVRLRAYQDEEGNWFLNGNKRFITNGCAKVHLVLARSEEGSSDGRGLSMFICEACPELVVRRIEDKLGIHGVATCELQYNDVPAQLCGLRRRGLTKYVMSLMNGARMAISAQAIGIAEAAYREARKYAEERKQFKLEIDKLPAVYDMLSKMKIKLHAARTLLYIASRSVDLRNGYTHLVEHGNPTAEDRKQMKYYVRLAALLTPMCKALATEVSNEVAYDSIQIHGGTGFMRDFNVERYYRDARITNIYEGTTQLQVVAAIGGVMQRVGETLYDELKAVEVTGPLARLKEKVAELHEQQKIAVKFVADKKDPAYHDLMAGKLVAMETNILVGYTLINDAMKDTDRAVIAEQYVNNAVSEFEKNFKIVTSDDYTIIDNHRAVIDY
ncbi:acyl-CoA dehydrogenase family protein [Lentisphaerota bacterium WC36G]|nr:acyl-CoA dehydrogenase family protein [Lentisphaerae bacterium WC36]